MNDQTIQEKGQEKTSELKWTVHEEIEADLKTLDVITRQCQMHTTSVEFEEREGVLRLKRVSLVAWDHERRLPTIREIVVHCGAH